MHFSIVISIYCIKNSIENCVSHHYTREKQTIWRGLVCIIPPFPPIYSLTMFPPCLSITSIDHPIILFTRWLRQHEEMATKASGRCLHVLQMGEVNGHMAT